MGTEWCILDSTGPQYQGIADTIVQLIPRSNPGVIAPSQPRSERVRGFIFDLDTGRLREVKVLEDQRTP